MKYRADYLIPSDDRGATQLILADSDEAAHTIALLHIPDGMTLHSVYRVEVRPDERRRIRDTLSDTSDPSKGQLYDTLELLLNALDEADSEAESLRARVAELEGRVKELERERETLRMSVETAYAELYEYRSDTYGSHILYASIDIARDALLPAFRLLKTDRARAALDSPEKEQ